MHLNFLFKKDNDNISKKGKVNVPDGLFTKCPKCSKMILTDELFLDNCVCHSCGYYFKIDAKTRISMVIDKDTFEEWDTGIEEKNPCDFEGYIQKTADLKSKTGLDEAIVTGKGKIDGKDTVIGVCDTRFLMGSMGIAVGEKITRLTEYAMKRKLPLIIFAASGGARMQEGLFSLMQMAKTTAAIEKFKDAGGLFISYLTNPTTGGVSASFASLGDIIIAEPGALICFAGPRVIEQTIGQKLPEGFQRAEFLLEHGFVDQVVPRTELKEVLTRILQLHTRGRKRR